MSFSRSSLNSLPFTVTSLKAATSAAFPERERERERKNEKCCLYFRTDIAAGILRVRSGP
jgi:hypothetical protein